MASVCALLRLLAPRFLIILFLTSKEEEVETNKAPINSTAIDMLFRIEGIYIYIFLFITIFRYSASIFNSDTN